MKNKLILETHPAGLVIEVDIDLDRFPEAVNIWDREPISFGSYGTPSLEELKKEHGYATKWASCYYALSSPIMRGGFDPNLLCIIDFKHIRI